MSDYNLHIYSGKATGDNVSDPQVSNFTIVLAFDGPGGKNYKIVGVKKHKFNGKDLYMPNFMASYLSSPEAELSLVDPAKFLKQYGFSDGDIANALTDIPGKGPLKIQPDTPRSTGPLKQT